MDPRTTSSIVGRLVDADGNAIPDATVLIETSDQPHHDIAQLTSDDGSFRFIDLLPGTYTIAARAPDGSTARTTTKVAPGRVVTLHLTPP